MFEVRQIISVFSEMRLEKKSLRTTGLHALVFAQFENPDSHKNGSTHTVINQTLVSKSRVVQRTS